MESILNKMSSPPTVAAEKCATASILFSSSGKSSETTLPVPSSATPENNKFSTDVIAPAAILQRRVSIFTPPSTIVRPVLLSISRFGTSWTQHEWNARVGRISLASAAPSCRKVDITDHNDELLRERSIFATGSWLR